MIPGRILTGFEKIIGIVCVNSSRLLERSNSETNSQSVILRDKSAAVSTSRLVFHVQNFAICRAPLGLSSIPCSRCCLLTDFTVAIFRTMCEQIVVSSCLDHLLTLSTFCQSIPSRPYARIGDNRRKFLFNM